MEKQYRILILIAQKQIQALSVDDKGRTEPISINGNVRMSYNSSDDLNELITSIKDTYNIDSFSDLVFSVFVVNFDADTKILKQLCAMLDGANDLNTVNAAFILPFASGKKEKFKKDENRTAQILESDYHICLNEDFSIVCEKAASGADENTQILVAEDFAFIFNLSAKDFGLLEEEIKAEIIEETIKEQSDSETEEKTEQIPEKGSLPMVVENQPPAVTENKIVRMVFVEGGNIDSDFVEKNLVSSHSIAGKYTSQYFGERIEDFYISSTPVTVQEYYDVTGNLPTALLYLLLHKNGYEEDKYMFKDDPFISEQELNAVRNLKKFFVMPKAVLERVDKTLLDKATFYEKENVYTELINQYGKNTPVTYITENEVSFFCNELSKRENLEPCYNGIHPIEKEGYRLPTPKEWLYAALGGINHNDFQYSGSDTLSDVGWYKDNSLHTIHSVEQRNPNTLGLYDMSGLIRECVCACTIDTYTNYAIGGSYCTSYEKCALARINESMEVTNNNSFFCEKDVGFRVCRSTAKLKSWYESLENADSF
mgnify:CR=1 FL=1